MEVSIPSKLHNSLIGAKGRFIRSIMEECGGVHIHFPTEGSGSDTVTIRGPAQDVEKAKKQLLHLAEEKVSPDIRRGADCFGQPFLFQGSNGPHSLLRSLLHQTAWPSLEGFECSQEE